ncbi:hypothetical protein [Phytohabitans kaempferiae]|uniref:Uncharacterized protein n=1 Tax=Phytohabitans kaempferiae TaxID=1620943 RepID=A0ABV6LUX9_9ACTN
MALSQYVLALPSVTRAAPVEPLAWLLADAGLPAAMLVLAPVPLPERPTEVGLLLALLVIVTVPVRFPSAVGRK